MRILVAEDYNETRALMKLLLEMRGNDVIEACNGQEAVEQARVAHPDLILMDLNMPVMDGLEATRVLRQFIATSQVPIVALSALCGTGEWHDKALSAGCNECLSKPLDFDAFDAMLSHYAH